MTTLDSRIAYTRLDGNPIPAIASMVLPQIAELVFQHVRSTHTPCLASEDTLLPVSSSLAAISSQPVVCSDPAGCGEAA